MNHAPGGGDSTRALWLVLMFRAWLRHPQAEVSTAPPAVAAQA